MTPGQILPILAALIAAGAIAAMALGAPHPGGAGHNPATDKLEAAFKVALYERSVSLDGCYPQPPLLAKELKAKGFKAGVAGGPNSVRRFNVVFVLRQGNTCGHLRMAFRASTGLYILNSASGNIRVAGRRGFRTDPGLPGPARSLTLSTKTYRLNQPEQQGRLDILCPGKRYPLGGGLIVKPPSNPDGEGLYPHSYERLGARLGYHISVILFDGNPSSTTPREATIQVVCARGLLPANPSPHRTVFIKQGETRSATARCPKGQYLISGGFQRTDFGADGGNYHRVPRPRPPGLEGLGQRVPAGRRRADRDRLLRAAKGPDPHRGLGLDSGRRTADGNGEHADMSQWPDADLGRVLRERLKRRLRRRGLVQRRRRLLGVGLRTVGPGAELHRLRLLHAGQGRLARSSRPASLSRGSPSRA